MFRKTLLAATLAVLTGPAAAGSTVDLNEASADKLAAKLDGVGSARAESIVEHRNEHGSFKSVSGLVQVDGIGEVTLKKNRDRLTVDSE